MFSAFYIICGFSSHNLWLRISYLGFLKVTFISLLILCFCPELALPGSLQTSESGNRDWTFSLSMAAESFSKCPFIIQFSVASFQILGRCLFLQLKIKSSSKVDAARGLLLSPSAVLQGCVR